MKKENVNDYLMQDADGVGLYVGTYKKYAEGSIEGAWIDLESCNDAEEFFEVCHRLHEDEADPEFMMQDFQGFPEEFYHESMCADDVQRIIDWLALDEDEREMVEAYVRIHGCDLQDFEDILEKARDRFMGKYDSFRDFTDECADEQIECLSSGVPEFFTRYFNYEAFERDMRFDYSFDEESGCVFRDC